MFKTISVALTLLVTQVSVLAATPYPIYPTEAQYIKYEIELEQFFSLRAIAPDAGKYFRTSDRQRRHDGKMLCKYVNCLFYKGISYK